MSEPSDFELLEKWRAGDKVAGDALVRRHFDSLFRFFELKVPKQAKDLTQKSLLGCVEGRDDFRRDGSFKAYLFGIARRQLLLHFRSSYRATKVFSPEEVSIDQLGEPQGMSPSGAMAEHDQQRLLLGALRRIPIDFQITMELFYWEDLPIADIAQVLGVAIGTVKSRLGRARQLVRDQVEALAASDELRRSTIDNLERWAESLRRGASLHASDPEG